MKHWINWTVIEFSFTIYTLKQAYKIKYSALQQTSTKSEGGMYMCKIDALNSNWIKYLVRYKSVFGLISCY